jgi:hypothetical protein
MHQVKEVVANGTNGRKLSVNRGSRFSSAFLTTAGIYLSTDFGSTQLAEWKGRGVEMQLRRYIQKRVPIRG